MAENTYTNYELRRRARGAEVPLPARNWRRRLLLGGILAAFLIACVAGGFIWYRLTRVFTVSARVQAATVSLAPIVDARLEELVVEEGTPVRRGQVLARLDTTELQAALESAEATLKIRQAGYAEARARFRLAEARLAGDIERARAEVRTAAANVAEAEAAVAARKARLSDEIRVASARCSESRARLKELTDGPRAEDIEAAEARLESAQALHALYKMELEQSRKLATEGIDSQHLLEVRRTQVVTQEKAVEQARLELDRLRAGATAAAIEAGKQALAAREAELALTRAGSNEVASLEAELAVRQAEHSEAEAVLRQAEAQRAAVDIAEEQMHSAEAELSQAEADVKGRRAVLDSRDLVSPVDGIVIRTFRRVGEVCGKGVPCILVSDDSKPRWVEGFLREEDAMRVEIGQRARVRAPANSGDTADAVLEQVGLHTASLDDGGTRSAETGSRYLQPERVWVRLRPLEALKGNPITGTSAQAVIFVR